MAVTQLESPPIKLTQFSHGGGCACKVAPADLEHVLHQLPVPDDPGLIQSLASGGDAVVYQLSSDTALVLSVDFMTPVVNNPYTFGAIAAANALSDIYAVGARPILALNVAGFATKALPVSLLESIIRGGSDKVREAGAWIAGGNVIDDYEPKYGLVVLGMVHPQRIVHSNTARPGDQIILTKALGHGLLATGIDHDLLDETATASVEAAMSELNRAASDIMVQMGAHASSDVGGFGLLGQLHAMAQASGVGAVVALDNVPVLPQAHEMARLEVIPNGTRNNRRYFGAFVAWESGNADSDEVILHDAQPSGGLLIVVPPDRSEAMLRALHEAGVRAAAVIGEVTTGPVGRIVVRNRAASGGAHS